MTGTGHIPRERAWAVCWPHGGVIFETVRRTQREAREAFLDRWDETRDMKWADARKRYGVASACTAVWLWLGVFGVVTIS